MLDRLPASCATRSRSGASLFGASVLHAGVIVAAILATTRALPPPVPGRSFDTNLIYSDPARSTGLIPAGLPDPVTPDVRIPDPVVLPSDATSPRSVSLDDGWRPPRDGWTWGDPGGTTNARAGSVGSGSAITAALADEPPVRLAGPPLRYPPLLRSAGIEGEVTLEVVVGADGVPDSASVSIIASSHPAFTDAARRAVLGGRYRPGRLSGGPVAVLVRQTVRFRLEP